MLLKQGWYNYEYVFLKGNSRNGVPTKFEGSHYETENDYTVLIYYRNPRERYDRVIGYRQSTLLTRFPIRYFRGNQCHIAYGWYVSVSLGFLSYIHQQPSAIREEYI